MAVPTLADEPLANSATFRVLRDEDGYWLADDAEVECHASGPSPSEAVAALLEAEREYLEILESEQDLAPAMAKHLRILTARLDAN